MASLPLAACPPSVLCFAHSDPTSGGGLQADLLTLASLGTHPLTVVTALTVQDTSGPSGSLVVDAEWVEDQARALLEDMPIAAFKVGLLGSAEQVATVAGILADYDQLPLVLHPAPVRLLHDEAAEDEVFEALRDLLLPQAALLIIDAGDAVRLLGDLDDAEHADDAGHAVLDTGDVAAHDVRPHSGTAAALLAARLLESGCTAVLLTGVGATGGGRSNLLFADGALRFTQPWDVVHGNPHGAGETLAAALAACIAGGDELVDAIRNAHDYTAQALTAGFRPGMGRILPDRLFWARAAAAEDVAGAADAR